MINEMENIGTEVETQKQPETDNSGIKDILIKLLTENEGDTTKTIERLVKESTAKMGKGKAPNKLFNLVNSTLSQLSSLQDEVDRLEIGTRISKNKVFNILINDSVREMNRLVGEDLYELVEEPPEEFDRLDAYSQALIEIENKIPNLKGKDREAAFWNISRLSKLLGK